MVRGFMLERLCVVKMRSRSVCVGACVSVCACLGVCVRLQSASVCVVCVLLCNVHMTVRVM
jgi:hypothetical protein